MKQKLQLLQDTADTALRERAAVVRAAYRDNDPTPRAVVCAAFACLPAAQHARLADGADGTFATAIDRPMASVTQVAGSR